MGSHFSAQNHDNETQENSRTCKVKLDRNTNLKVYPKTLRALRFEITYKNISRGARLVAQYNNMNGIHERIMQLMTESLPHLQTVQTEVSRVPPERLQRASFIELMTLLSAVHNSASRRENSRVQLLDTLQTITSLLAHNRTIRLEQNSPFRELVNRMRHKELIERVGNDNNTYRLVARYRDVLDALQWFYPDIDDVGYIARPPEFLRNQEQ